MHPDRGLLRSIVALLVLGALLAGCGGDDDGDDGPDSSYDRAAFCDAFADVRGSATSLSNVLNAPNGDADGIRTSLDEAVADLRVLIPLLPSNLEDDGSDLGEELDDLEDEFADADDQELRRELPPAVEDIVLPADGAGSTAASRILAFGAEDCA